MLARAMVEELMQKLWLLSEEMWLNNLSEFILKLIQSKIEYRRWANGGRYADACLQGTSTYEFLAFFQMIISN